MITQERLADKPELVDKMAQLRQFVHDAARDGTAAHEVERGLFRRLLSLGHDLLGEFFVLQGSGDMGEQLTLPDGEVLQRQPELPGRRADREAAVREALGHRLCDVGFAARERRS